MVLEIRNSEGNVIVDLTGSLALHYYDIFSKSWDMTIGKKNIQGKGEFTVFNVIQDFKLIAGKEFIVYVFKGSYVKIIL